MYVHKRINEDPENIPGKTVHANVQSHSKQLPTLHATELKSGEILHSLNTVQQPVVDTW